MKRRLTALLLTLAIVLTAIPAATFYSPDEPYILGDVNGDGVVDFLDVLEILKFLAKLPSVINNDPRALQASLIRNPDASLPTHLDVTEILNFLAGIASLIEDGNNPERHWIVHTERLSSVPIRAEIDVNVGTISYFTMQSIATVTSLYIDYTITKAEAVEFESIGGNGRLPGNSQFNHNFSRGTGRLQALIEIDGAIPADTMVMRQQFTGGDNFHNAEIMIRGKDFRYITLIGCYEVGCCGRRMLGDVNGDGVVDFLDFMEILDYLDQRPSALTSDPYAFMVADTDLNGSVTIWDAIEILRFLEGNRKFLNDGNNPNLEWFVKVPNPPSPKVRAEICPVKGIISYYTTEELKPLDLMYIEYTVTAENVAAYHVTTPPIRDLHDIGQVSFREIGLYRFAFEVTNTIPANTLLMIQEFDGFDNTMTVTGKGIERVTVFYRLGDVDGDGRITISDALEILKHLAKLDSAITADNHDFSRNAASITADNPTISCALEILKHLAKLNSVLN
jgi:Ca2+-binding EF-hand superfamily protein